MLYILIEKARAGLTPMRVRVTRGRQSYTATVWINPNKDKQNIALGHKRGMQIPPSATNVWLNPDKTDPMQVKYTDAKGRWKVVYKAEFCKNNEAEKFARLKDFTKERPKLLKQIEKDMSKSPPLEEAKVLYLMDKTGFRIGSDGETKAAVKAYGATTLESNHVKVSGDKVEFNFIGKKGVKITQEVRDSKVAEIVRDRKGKLFGTDAGKVRNYLKKIDGGFKPKDFRTYVATSMAAALVKMRPTQPKTEKERKQTIKGIATLVSRKLGNTPAMAQKSYISPEVFNKIRIGG